MHRADQGDALLRLERQQVLLVLEQHGGFRGGLARERTRRDGLRLALGGGPRGRKRALEQAQIRLQGQHAADRFVDHFDGDVAALERVRQTEHVGGAQHVDIDARMQRERGSLRQILRNAVLDEFGHGVEVAHDHAVETPAAAHRVPQQRRTGGRRNSGKIIEGRHDRSNAGLRRGTERRQIDLVQMPFGNVDRGVVAARRHRAIGADVFHCCGDGIGPARGPFPGSL